MRELRELADEASRDVITLVLRAYEQALAKRTDARRRGRRTAVREGQPRPPLSLGSGVWLAYERFVDRVTFLEDIGKDVSGTNRGAIVEQLDAVAIVNPVRDEPWLGPVMDAWRASNVELIRGLGDEARGRINDVVQDAWQRGMSVADLERNLEEAAGIVGRRAELIARDQVGKLNGQLTMARQSALGIESYRWITSMDERVRQSHADLHDTIHRWDDPPAEGHPGSPVQCRCHAEPEIEDAINALEALGETAEFDAQGRVVLREGMPDDGTAERALETLGRWAPASTMEEARAELARRVAASADVQQQKQRAQRNERQGRAPRAPRNGRTVRPTAR